MVLSWSFCYKCTPVDSSRRPQKDKFGMVSEIFNQQQNAELIGSIKGLQTTVREEILLMMKK